MPDSRFMTGCLGKRVYADKISAVKSAKMMKRRHAPLLRAYRCTFCHAWHLTSCPLMGRPAKNHGKEKSQ